MSKHYAAPWEMVVRDNGYAEINAKADSHYAFARAVVRMAYTESAADNDRLMANARMIAAAPEMYEALKSTYDFIRDQYGDAEAQALQGECVAKEARPVWGAICAAIAKAEGRT